MKFEYICRSNAVIVYYSNDILLALLNSDYKFLANNTHRLLKAFDRIYYNYHIVPSIPVARTLLTGILL